MKHFSNTALTSNTPARRHHHVLSPPRLGLRGRRFKSCHSDQLSSLYRRLRETIWGMKRLVFFIVLYCSLSPKILERGPLIARRPGNAQTFFRRNSYMPAWDSAPG